jgi:hypothetical protein
MAMQKPKLIRRTYLHWLLSTQVERMEVLVLPKSNRHVSHAKDAALAQPNF